MLLVSLVIITFIDHLSIQEFPLLSQYAPQIDINQFNVLLLPRREEMKCLFHMEQHFKSRVKNSKFKSILVEVGQRFWCEICRRKEC